MAAKLPAAPITRSRPARGVPLDQLHARTPRPLPIAISGASGPSTTPRQSVASDARKTPGSSSGVHGAARLEALGRLVPRGAGQVADGERDEQPAQREPRKRPPDRLAAEPEVLRQRREEELLRLRDELQEAVRDGDHHADERADHQQRKVIPTARSLSGSGGPADCDDEASELFMASLGLLNAATATPAEATFRCG